MTPSDLPETTAVRVLFDTRERHFEQNPYVNLLREALAPRVRVEGFSWGRALLGRYDLAHLHWPEYMLRPGPRWMRPIAAAALRLWLWRLRLRGTPVVRTMHDLAPLVALTPDEAGLLGRVADQVGARIWLTAPDGLPGAPDTAPEDVIIPHGDYLPWLAGQAAAAGPLPSATRDSDEPFELLCFGILRPYKRFEQVIAAAVELPADANVRLRVLGSAPEPDYRATLIQAAQAAPDRVEVVTRRATDRELYLALGEADLVVVPYDELYNSGVVLLALSAARPVALRENIISRALQEEFGAGWVNLWSGDLDARKLAGVIDEARAPRPALDIERSRGWDSVGNLHRAFYVSQLANDVARADHDAVPATHG